MTIRCSSGDSNLNSTGSGAFDERARFLKEEKRRLKLPSWQPLGEGQHLSLASSGFQSGDDENQT